MKHLLTGVFLMMTATTTALAEDTAATVAEIVQFRLAPGVTEAEFKAAASATMPRVAAFDGFVARTLSRDDTGLWTDHVLWTDLDHAMAAAEAFGSDPVLAAFGAAISPEGMVMTHGMVALTD